VSMCEHCAPEPLYLPGHVVDPVTGTVMPLAMPWSEPIPRFLDRTAWTEEEWAIHKARQAVTLATRVEASARARTDLVMPAKRRRKRKVK